MKRAIASLIPFLLASVPACKSGEADARSEVSSKGGTAVEKAEKKVIDSPVAGSWYTADGRALGRELRGYLDEADLSAADGVTGPVVGLVSPHAGYRYSGRVQAYGYKTLVGAGVKRVIVMGPSHHVALDGYALSEATHWRTPLGEVPFDIDAVRKLSSARGFRFMEEAFTREHSVDMQIPFIQTVAPKATIVPIVVGQVGPEAAKEAGRAIRALLDGHTVLVASSDFTHYGPNFGYVPFDSDVEGGLRKLRDEAVAAIVEMDLDAFYEHVSGTGDTICGRAPIMTLLSAVPGSATPVPLKYDTSGRMTGDWKNSVSYQSIAFYMTPNRGPFRGTRFLDEKEQAMLLKLARETIRRHLAGKPLPDPKKDWKEIPEKISRDFGVFVTLKKHGTLRGCIGSILPMEPLYEGVIRNAVNAASRDPRFKPMIMSEEPEVEIEVSVLTPPREVFEARDVKIGRDGVIIEKGHNRAVYLPQVAPEQGWDLETTLTHLSMKAGLAGDAWKSGTRFKTFQAQVFHEGEELVN